MCFVERSRLLAACALLCLSSACLATEMTSSADASSSGSVSNGSSPNCVLHVWPGAPARSSYTGWFHGGAVDGDKRGIKGYPPMHSDVLSTPVQQRLLEAVDWSHRVHASNLTVVVHNEPPAAQDDQSRTTPLISDRPDCYRELIVHSVLVERAVFSATTVRLMIIAKKWHSHDAQPSTFSVMTDERVKLDEHRPETLESSLKDGFVASIDKTLSTPFFQKP